MQGRHPRTTCAATMSTFGSRLVLVGGYENWDMRIHVAEIQSGMLLIWSARRSSQCAHLQPRGAACDMRESIVKLQFTTETTHRQFTTEVVDLSRFVRKQGDGAYALAGYSDVWRGEMTDTGQSVSSSPILLNDHDEALNHRLIFL